MTDYTVGDTLHILFTTRAFATGIPFVLAGSPVVSAYEDASLTQITAGITLGVDHDSVVGLNLLTIVATGGNGYDSGSDYHMVVTTGTVDSVSVVGEVVGRFTLGRSAAAVDLANGTDGLGILLADIATAQLDLDTITGAAGAIIDVSTANDTTMSDAIWDEDATGHQTTGTFGQAIGDPAANTETMYDAVVTDAAGTNVAADVIAIDTVVDLILVDTGTTLQGELDGIQADTEDIQARLPAALVSGRMSSDMVSISGDTVAADNLEESATSIVLGAAEAGTLSATAMTSDLTEATDDHYIGRTVIWTTGVLAGQASDITDYLGSTGMLTYSTLTEAPSATDTFVIV